MVGCSHRLRRAVEIWLSEAGIGGNIKSSSLRGFDTGPLLEFADRENLLGNSGTTTHALRKETLLIRMILATRCSPIANLLWS